jgi:uncharacterized beta-barrel protein YwiB (DUF1934 family)
MNHQVNITLHTIRRMEGAEEESKCSYTGRLGSKAQTDVLQYMTRDEQGTIRTKITLGDTGCSLENIGDMHRVMEFLPGERTSFAMKMPFGELEMEVHTKEYIIHKKTVPHLSVTLQYDLYHNGELLSENTLEIGVEPRNERAM